MQVLFDQTGCASTHNVFVEKGSNLNKVGSTPYHICYTVSDMNKAIEGLADIGFTQMGYPAISIPLGGDVCFLYSDEIGVVELIKYTK